MLVILQVPLYERALVPNPFRDSDVPLMLKLRFAASGHDDTGTIRSLPNSLIF